MTSNETLVGLFPRYKNLQELDISMNGGGPGDIGDDCLWIIGTHCKHLRYTSAAK